MYVGACDLAHLVVVTQVRAVYFICSWSKLLIIRTVEIFWYLMIIEIFKKIIYDVMLIVYIQ